MTTDPTAVHALHVASTLYMVGLIWFVQLVHYPLMDRVPPSGFAEFERAHASRTSWAVGPPMLVEMATAVSLVVVPGLAPDSRIAILGLVILIGIWISTALLQVPAHGLLAEGFDEDVHRRLVRTNWIRTLLWTARGWVALSLAGLL
jgi:hypothetical protein